MVISNSNKLAYLIEIIDQIVFTTTQLILVVCLSVYSIGTVIIMVCTGVILYLNYHFVSTIMG